MRCRWPHRVAAYQPLRRACARVSVRRWAGWGAIVASVRCLPGAVGPGFCRVEPSDATRMQRSACSALRVARGASRASARPGRVVAVPVASGPSSASAAAGRPSSSAPSCPPLPCPRPPPPPAIGMPVGHIRRARATEPPDGRHGVGRSVPAAHPPPVRTASGPHPTRALLQLVEASSEDGGGEGGGGWGGTRGGWLGEGWADHTWYRTALTGAAGAAASPCADATATPRSGSSLTTPNFRARCHGVRACVRVCACHVRACGCVSECVCGCVRACA
jgi:hypothetical protein